MTFTDTHCHIHDDTYPDAEGAYERAMKAGVGRLLCIGENVDNSMRAVEFALAHENAWAVIGIHPHEVSKDKERIQELKELLDDPEKNKKIVGIGEIGLDYYYEHSPRTTQIEVLGSLLQLATEYKLPVSFHVREAFEDFWPIFDAYQGVRGVLHSYTDNLSNMAVAMARGLYIGVNGISTFAKDKQDIYAAIPLENMLLETDSPFLTPVPHRGTLNEPAFVTHVAHFIANLQSINLEELSRATERNATNLFITNTAKS